MSRKLSLSITFGLSLLLLGCSASGDPQASGGRGSGGGGNGSGENTGKRQYAVRQTQPHRDSMDNPREERGPLDHGTLGKVRTLSGRLTAVDPARNMITVEVKGSPSTFQVDPGVSVMSLTFRTANSQQGLENLQPGSQVTINVESRGNQERVSLIQLK
jgi:hypothetical protein